MRKRVAGTVLAIVMAVVAATPVLASTETRTVVGQRYTVTCVITYTESSGDARVDTLNELFSITNVTCTVVKNP